MVTIYYWDKKLKKKIACPGRWYSNNKKKRWFDVPRWKDVFLTEWVPNDRHCACFSESLSYYWVPSILRHPVFLINSKALPFLLIQFIYFWLILKIILSVDSFYLFQVEFKLFLFNQFIYFYWILIPFFLLIILCSSGKFYGSNFFFS